MPIFGGRVRGCSGRRRRHCCCLLLMLLLMLKSSRRAEASGSFNNLFHVPDWVIKPIHNTLELNTLRTVVQNRFSEEFFWLVCCNNFRPFQ